jgi:hypothetical protein
VTLTPKYRFDRASAWQTDAGIVAVAGTSIIRLPIPIEGARFYEAQFGFDMTNSNASDTAPKILSVNFEYDDNREEDANAQ